VGSIGFLRSSQLADQIKRVSSLDKLGMTVFIKAPWSKLRGKLSCKIKQNEFKNKNQGCVY
jgi:hypothetical protein